MIKVYDYENSEMEYQHDQRVFFEGKAGQDVLSVSWLLVLLLVLSLVILFPSGRVLTAATCVVER